MSNTNPSTAENVGRWIKSPEARAWAYNVALAGIGLLITLGIITSEHGGGWAILAAAVLGMPATALARANVPTRGP